MKLSKELVLSVRPEAEFVRDGWDLRAGDSGCYDCAIFDGESFLGQGTNPTQAWNKARALLRSLGELE